MRLSSRHTSPQRLTYRGDPMTEQAAVETGTTWRSLLRFLCFAYVALLVIVTLVGLVVGMNPAPPFVVAAVVNLAAGLWLTRSTGRGAVIFGLVVGVLNLLGTWWLVFGLFQVTSPVEFVLSVGYVLFGLALIPVAIAALRRPGAPGGGRTRTVLMSLMGVAVVAAVVGAFVAPDDARQDGDLVVEAANLEFDPEELSADAGQVAFFLDNQDLIAHDIAVREDDGDLDTENDDDPIDKALAPGNKGARLEVDLAAGTYEYYCSIHPEMQGLLTVT